MKRPFKIVAVVSSLFLLSGYVSHQAGWTRTAAASATPRAISKPVMESDRLLAKSANAQFMPEGGEYFRMPKPALDNQVETDFVKGVLAPPVEWLAKLPAKPAPPEENLFITPPATPAVAPEALTIDMTGCAYLIYF